MESNKQADLMNKRQIKFIHGDESTLEEIKTLWQALNDHHFRHSINFKQDYSSITFEKRKAYLTKKAALGELRVDQAIDKATGLTIGYVVSSIDSEKTGEIDSFFVDEDYRGKGIGDALIKKALKWMDQKGAGAKIVEVANGNEHAFAFYAKYGFLPRRTVLKQVRN